MACLFWFPGCAQYHLGSQFLYRNDIRSVHVMMFESESNRRFLGQRLTEAVVKAVELETPFTITDPAIADSFVRGRLVRDRKSVAGENVNDEPRTLTIGMRLEIDWVDRAGVPLLQRPIVIIDRSAELIPEGGQSLTVTQQEIIDRMARDVVSQMQNPW
ncbi:MAG: LPS assembly lipoprotein LptE [Planctomycetota bacterium]